ncbi:MAG: phosphoadenosine phosphosulfate reductase family protein [Desulfurococcaceae archaeon]
MWPLTVRLFWDPWRNTPVIKPKQEEIDLLYQLKLSEPGDARPAFRGDHERLRTAIVYEFGDDKLYRRYIEGRFLLLNKVPHWDVMYEVVSSGNVIGQLYYDPYISTWRFRLTYQGAYLAYQDNIVDVVKGKPPFHVDKAIESNISTSSRQVVIVDEKGSVRGVGEVISNKVVVAKVFYDKTLPVETSGKTASLEDVLKYNREGLEALEEKAIKYLKRIQNRYPSLKPVVSYSGGKDSLVTLDLAHRAYGSLEIIFNDTGLEMPETLNNVEKVADLYGHKLYVASAGDIFWRAVEVFGPPGKDYRWCCKVAKLVPIAKLTKTVWPGGALNLVGQRAYESLDRAKSPLVWRNKWIPHMISTTPIQYWSQLACWLYIYKYKLPYNRLYEEGFDRLGCYLCPSCALAEYRDVERKYPELWSKWLSVLEKWRDKLNMPSEWISMGLWRWLTPATAKKRIIHRLPGYSINWRDEYLSRIRGSRVSIIPEEVINANKSLVLKFNNELVTEEKREIFIKNIVNVGFNIINENPLVFEKNGNVFELTGEILRVTMQEESEGFEDLVDVLKVVYRINGCVHCGSCVLWSKKGAVKLTQNGPYPVEHLNEKQARLYIDVCPISDQLVEKVIVPLITNDYKSYKRKSRRKPIL